MPIGIEIRNAETVGVVPKCTFETSTCGLRISATPTTTSSAWVARSAMARKMLSFADSWMPRMLSSASTTQSPAATTTCPVRPLRMNPQPGNTER